MGIPRQHQIDAPIEYVWAFDEAWDRDRIDDEDALLEDDCPHPWTLYQGGFTRYDLDTAREWLLPDVEPVVFTLKRLDLATYAAAMTTIRKGHAPVAYASVWRKGLVKVTGLDMKESDPALKDGLTAKDYAGIADYLGHDVILEIGKAVLEASKPLSVTEKKRCDTLAGDSNRSLAIRIEEKRLSTAGETASEPDNGTTAHGPDTDAQE